MNGAIVIGGKLFTGPKDWEQLTTKQFLQWVRFQLKGADPAGWFGLLQLWYKLRYQHLRLLDDDQRGWLLDEVFAPFGERPSRWMLPVLRLGYSRYIGPGDRLQNLTFGEFMFAEAARQAFDESPTQEQLAELAAAIYRPSKTRLGELLRSEFDRHRMDQQIDRFCQLPMDVLEAIRINYFGCIDQLPARFEHLFPTTKKSSGEGGTWLDVGLNLARQTGALGTFHEMEKTNVYLVLAVLDDVLREQKEMAENLKNND